MKTKLSPRQVERCTLQFLKVHKWTTRLEVSKELPEPCGHKIEEGGIDQTHEWEREERPKQLIEEIDE